jgi:enoyl-[acyl-carrier-protein] reductase (NADH)
MKFRTIFFLLICFFTFQNNLKSQDIKEKKWQLFIKQLNSAIQNKNINNIKKLVLPETNAIATIEMDLKNMKSLNNLKNNLNLKFEKFDSEEWERVINYTDKDVIRAYYFSYKNDEWKLAEIAETAND